MGFCEFSVQPVGPTCSRWRDIEQVPWNCKTNHGICKSRYLPILNQNWRLDRHDVGKHYEILAGWPGNRDRETNGKPASSYVMKFTGLAERDQCVTSNRFLEKITRLSSWYGGLEWYLGTGRAREPELLSWDCLDSSKGQRIRSTMTMTVFLGILKSYNPLWPLSRCIKLIESWLDISRIWFRFVRVLLTFKV